MALIRQAQLGDAVRSAVVLDLGDLTRQGERIKAAARAEADRIVAEGREEGRRLFEGAAEEGRRQGLSQGLEEGRTTGAEEGRAALLAEFRPRLEAMEKGWTEALEDFRARRESLLMQARADVLALAARVAEMVTRRAVELNGGAAEAQLAAVLALVAGPTKLTVKVTAREKRAFGEALRVLSAKFEAAEHAEIVVDESLPPGSCVVATPSGGEIDASVETQLERIVGAIVTRERRRKQPRSRKP